VPLGQVIVLGTAQPGTSARLFIGSDGGHGHLAVRGSTDCCRIAAAVTPGVGTVAVTQSSALLAALKRSTELQHGGPDNALLHAATTSSRSKVIYEHHHSVEVVGITTA
jgi:hypothetical protein